MKTEFFTATPENLDAIATLLKNNEVVALPTETVYGLAGNATEPRAVLKIFEAKERPSFDPLIVHVSENLLHRSHGILSALVEQKVISEKVLQWTAAPMIEKTLKHFWPGPLTVILPRGNQIPDEVTSSLSTVGIRMPNHNLFQEVLSRLPFPLAAPSANRFGRISPTDASHALEELDGRIAGILNGGPCVVGVESTIIQFSEDSSSPSQLNVSLLRPGKIGKSEIEALLGIPCFLNQSTQTRDQELRAELAPGMLEQHYAPKKPLIYVPFSFDSKEAQMFFEIYFSAVPTSGRKVGILSAHPVSNETVAALKKKNILATQILSLSAHSDLSETAQNLFRLMRSLDSDPTVEFILVDQISATEAEQESGLFMAIQDRLNRASANKPFLK